MFLLLAGSLFPCRQGYTGLRPDNYQLLDQGHYNNTYTSTRIILAFTYIEFTPVKR